jgi:hypothetical protein
VLTALLALACYAQAQPAADFYVARNGNDRWSGRLAEPNAAGTDGPLATLERARQTLRQVRTASPDRRGPLTVMVRGGTWELGKPLVFTPADSGTDMSPTVWAAYPGETPVISGGVALSGWAVNAEGRWELHLPQVQAGEWDFEQLFVSDQRRYRPRLPEEGYALIAAALPPTPGSRGRGCDRFRYAPGDMSAAWHNPGDVQVLAFHSWTMDRLRIASVDEAARAVTFVAPTLSDNGFFDLHAGGRYLVENVREALDDPGEWYLDRASGVLTYIPLPGEDPATTPVVAPRLESLLELRGEPALGLGVEHVTLRGLTFAHTNWTVPAEGYRCPQSEYVLRGAVNADGARHCRFEGCRVTHTGAYGMDFGRGSQDNVVDNCELTDLGAGGIKLGETVWRDDPAELACRNTLSNCLVAHGGRLHAAGMGVWVGGSPYNTLAHNEICDFYQTGVSVGWSWGYGPSQAHDNTVAYNRIYEIGQGVTADMGGIYTLGLSPGTVLHHNIIHGVSCDTYGGRGIYFDEGTSDLLCEDNIVYRTDTGTFMQHYGRDNVVRNNIWALARGGMLDRLREEAHNSFTFERNLVYHDEEGVLQAENWTNEHFVMDHNLYWNTAGPASFQGQTLEQWQARGHDLHSVVADPLFVDPRHGDFALREGSPALALGFQPIDVSQVGRLTVPAHAPMASFPPRAFPPKPGPRPPQPVAEDCEALETGDKPPGATVIEENDQASIRVTGEQASSGSRSLKFVDMPGLRNCWDPHLYYSPGFASGALTGRFAIRLDGRALAYHEWRQYPGGGSYLLGPALWFYPDGRLVANGQTVLERLPAGDWVRVQITCGLGPDSTGTYDLQVWLPGEAEARTFPGIVFDPAFKRLEFACFTANGEQAATFYVDDIYIGPPPAE